MQVQAYMAANSNTDNRCSRSSNATVCGSDNTPCDPHKVKAHLHLYVCAVLHYSLCYQWTGEWRCWTVSQLDHWTDPRAAVSSIGSSGSGRRNEHCWTRIVIIPRYLISLNWNGRVSFVTTSYSSLCPMFADQCHRGCQNPLCTQWGQTQPSTLHIAPLCWLVAD